MRRVAPSRQRAALATAAAAAAAAVTTAHAQAWHIDPSVRLAATYSDNVSLRPDSLAEKGWIFDVAPGIRVEHLSPRARIFADYRLHALSHTIETAADDTQQFLDATAQWKAFDDFLTLDARASITQQPRSPFAGTLPPDAASPSGNRAETRSFEVSPAIRGNLGNLALYQLRLTASEADATDLAIPRTRTTNLIGRLRSPSASSVVGWAVEGSQMQLRNRDVGQLQDSRLRGIAYLAVLPTARLSLSYGHEETDFLGAERERFENPGAGLDWVPGPRTQLSVSWEKRFFGDGYNLFFSHRTPMTAWRLAGSHDVSVLPNQLSSTNLRSVSSLLSDLLSSAQPDPIQRAAAVRARMQETFLPENSALASGLLSAQPFLLKAIEGSGAVLGRRNTVTVGIARREQRGLEGPGTFVGAEDVLRSVITANWAYRLTPLTTFTFSATYVRTEGLTGQALRTTDQGFTALYATRLGPNSTLSVGARRAQLESTEALSYKENAVVVTFTARI